MPTLTPTTLRACNSRCRLAALILLLLAPITAQVPPPNPAGVSAGHLHFKVRDLAANRRLWTEGFGAKPVKLGRLELLRLPGVLVLLQQESDHVAGSEGSVIGHVGLKVRDLPATLEKLRGLDVPVLSQNPETHQAFISTPEKVMIELTEDRQLGTPVANHHVHFYTADVDATKAWYVKTFGAIGGTRGKFQAADVPGVNLTFSAAPSPVAGTRGRSLDHIGFEVKGLEEFCRKLEASGVKFDLPYKKEADLDIGLAFFTDPWGTYIELTEGLNRL